MFTLRCTRKVLDRLHVTPAVEKVEPTTRLGDWYANLLFRPGGQVVLFVNARSLLPVLVAASPASSLVSRFQAAVAGMLLRLGVPAAIVEAELREMTEARIGKTASRQVLGVMTDFAFLMDAYRRDPMNLDAIAMWLAATPCGPIGMKHPADVAVEMLRGRAVAPGRRSRCAAVVEELHEVYVARRGPPRLDAVLAVPGAPRPGETAPVSISRAA